MQMTRPIVLVLVKEQMCFVEAETNNRGRGAEVVRRTKLRKQPNIGQLHQNSTYERDKTVLSGTRLVPKKNMIRTKPSSS